MKHRLNFLLAFGLAVGAVSLSGCGGGSNSGGSGSLGLVSCSLGCSTNTTGPSNCIISDVFVNQQIWFEFTEAVDIASVNGLTFQVFNSITGQTPPGLYSLDPSNPRRVFFQPTVSFDSSGSPSFGFLNGESYEVRIPGRNTTPSGQVILSVGGQENQTELDCFVNADKGIADIVSGPPIVAVTLESLSDNGLEIVGSEVAQNASDVPLNSRLRFEFNDVMNPASLVNPALESSDTITVAVDPDGNLSNAADQIELPGSFQIAVDTAGMRTEVLFTPDGGFPSSGSDPSSPRRIVVSLPQAILDLGGNSLANAGNQVFTTVSVDFPQSTLGEDFSQTSKIDSGRTGMLVETDAVVVESLPGGAAQELVGRLLPGLGGGSGVLGDLVVQVGDVLVLSTDPSIPTRLGPELITGPKGAEGESLDGVPEFNVNDFLDDPRAWVELNPGVVGELHVRTTLIDNYFVEGVEPNTGVVTVTDGTYSFASIHLQPSSQLKFLGQQPARLLGRGDILIQGLIDVAGRTPMVLDEGSETGEPDNSGGGGGPLVLLEPGEHDSSSGFGGLGGLPGPGGGRGGEGGDRPDSSGTGLTGSVALNGFVHEPSAEIDPFGAAGEGRGGVALSGGADAGAGGGGVAWPNPLPGPSVLDLGGFEPDGICFSAQVGAPGAGGSFATFGQPGEYLTPGQSSPVKPPPSSPGVDLLRASDIDLDPELGTGLIGGAGGGGGGAGIFGTRSNGVPSLFCEVGFGFPPAPLALLLYVDHSGAGGGGGGGAIQLQAGAECSLNSGASIRANGGAGAHAVSQGFDAEASRAAPGGGGSGGAVLIQAVEVALPSIPSLIDVSGGAGGLSGDPLAQPSIGGDGSPGVVQIFNSPDVPLNPSVVASSINSKSGAVDLGLDLSDYLVLGGWQGVPVGSGLDGPSASSGFQSCWQIPEGAVFGVEYLEDDLETGELGWDLKVQFAGLGVVDFRDKSGAAADLLGGSSLEEFLGSELGASPLVVRFQGARTVSGLADPCNAVEGEPFIAGSVTPWLRNSWELNSYWDSVPGLPPEVAEQRRPNVIRFQLVFQGSAPLAESIESVVEVSIAVQPD